MGVKVVEMYPGSWYVRVVYNHFRKTKHIGSKERALEVSRKLTTALELYGFDALKMFEDSSAEAAPKPVIVVPTINQYQVKWLSELEKTDVKRSTKELYTYLISKHVVPAFGEERPMSVRTAQRSCLTNTFVTVFLHQVLNDKKAILIQCLRGSNVLCAVLSPSYSRSITLLFVVS